MSGKPLIRCPNCKATMPYTAAACPSCGRRIVSTGGMVKGRREESVDIFEHTPYSECRSQACTFNVTERDATCPNCGIPSPYRSRSDAELATSLSSQWVGCYLIISMFVLAIVLAIVGANIVGKMDNSAPFVIVV